MANGFDPRIGAAPRSATTLDGRTAVDAGLRSYMLSVYNYMASGVLLTGIVALALAATGIAQQIFFGGGFLRYVVIFAPLLMVLFLGSRWGRLSTAGMQAFYWSFAAMMGVSMSVLPLLYSGTSIATTFFATSAAFVSLSLWGYTTKKDLTGFGSFLLMGVAGLIVAMLINIAFPTRGLSMAISYIGVLLFAGLTAYDTQKIKSLYFQVQGTEFIGKSAILGALTLYLDFINMFQFLLSIMGDRR